MHLHTLGHHVLLATVETGRGGRPPHGRVEPVGHRETVVRLSWGQCGNRFRAAGYRPWARWGGGPRSGDSRARRTAGVQLCSARRPGPSLPVRNALSGQVEFQNISPPVPGHAMEPAPERGAKLAVAIGPAPGHRPGARPAPGRLRPRGRPLGRRLRGPARAPVSRPPSAATAARSPDRSLSPSRRRGAVRVFGRGCAGMRKGAAPRTGTAPFARGSRARPPPVRVVAAAAGSGSAVLRISGCRCPGSPPPRGPPPGGRRGCGTASRRRSPGPPRGRSGRTPGRRRAHRRRRA